MTKPERAWVRPAGAVVLGLAALAGLTAAALRIRGGAPASADEPRPDPAPVPVLASDVWNRRVADLGSRTDDAAVEVLLAAAAAPHADGDGAHVRRHALERLVAIDPPRALDALRKAAKNAPFAGLAELVRILGEQGRPAHRIVLEDVLRRHDDGPLADQARRAITLIEVRQVVRLRERGPLNR